MSTRLLLLSSSRGSDGGYLVFALDHLRRFLGSIDRVLFVPYAAITTSHDEYAAMTSERFADIGVRIESIHAAKDPRAAIGSAPAIFVGGGNTFQLLATLCEMRLLDPLRTRVRSGAPYVGSSAGANLASPTISTTNDMPVVWPSAPTALGAVPFQINPHFVEGNPPGFHGETRRQRLAEFLAVSPDSTVVAMPEGAMLEAHGPRVRVVGRRAVRVLRIEGDRLVQPGSVMTFAADARLLAVEPEEAMGGLRATS
jgi:dipeptidase E